MKKIFLTTLLLVTMLFTACGGEQSSDDIRDKTFVIGVDDDFAPIAFRDENGNLVGFDIDLAKETGRRMGVTFEFKPIDWNNKRQELESGNIDLIWNGLDITDERKEYILYSKPYIDDRQILLVKKGDTQNIRSEGDLAGKIVGTQAGSAAETYVNKNDDIKLSVRNLKIYDKFKDAITALKVDEIDVLVCDEMIARYEMKTQPDTFEIVDVYSDYVTEMGIGFRKGDTELRDRVQKVFDEMIEDGTAKEISEKWFDADLIVHKR